MFSYIKSVLVVFMFTMFLSGCVPSLDDLPVDLPPWAGGGGEEVKSCLEDPFSAEWDGPTQRVQPFIKPVGQVKVTLSSDNGDFASDSLQTIISEVMQTAFFNHPYARERFRVLQEIDIAKAIQEGEVSEAQNGFISTESAIKLGESQGAQIALLLTVPSVGIEERSQGVNLIGSNVSQVIGQVSMRITMEMFDIETREVIARHTETIDKTTVLSLASNIGGDSAMGSTSLSMTNVMTDLEEGTVCALDKLLRTLR